ncbi:synaptotagmin-7-like isoform X2 [Rhopilema esculentum]|eukprot:gene5201-337_t
MHQLTRHLDWIIPTFVASLVTLISFVALCTYCFKRKNKENEEEEEAEEAYRPEKKLLSSQKEPELFPTLNVPPRAENAFSLPGTPSKVPIREPGFGKRSVKYGAVTPSMSPVFTEFKVQPPSRETKGILKGAESGLFGSAGQLDIPAEPEPPSGDAAEKLGTLFFNLCYNAEDLILKLYIQKATGLAAKDISGTSDPFVKVLLLPDKKHRLETRVKRKNLNPVWNEAFTFEGFPHQKLMQRTLYLQVLDYDRFSRNDPIGEVELNLADVHLQAEPVPYVKELKPCRRNPDYLGDLLISMCYNPTQSRITIVVMKCSNVKVMDITGSCDPYVKVYLKYGGTRIDKKKTAIKKRCLNPVWNEVFDFDVPIDKIRDISFVFTVMDFDRILSNEAIGQVIIGYRTAGSSLKHWTDMMNNPRKPIAMWHKIIKY